MLCTDPYTQKRTDLASVSLGLDGVQGLWRQFLLHVAYGPSGPTRMGPGYQNQTQVPLLLAQ